MGVELGEVVAVVVLEALYVTGVYIARLLTRFSSGKVLLLQNVLGLSRFLPRTRTAEYSLASFKSILLSRMNTVSRIRRSN